MIMSMTTARFIPSATLDASQAPARQGLTAWLMSIVKSYRWSMERRSAVAALRSLDDRLLKDIGIDRSEITSVVYDCGADRVRRNRR
jgi:uncharacterized protein YjiS (DUF1127 family)